MSPIAQFPLTLSAAYQFCFFMGLDVMLAVVRRGASKDERGHCALLIFTLNLHISPSLFLLCAEGSACHNLY